MDKTAKDSKQKPKSKEKTAKVAANAGEQSSDSDLEPCTAPTAVEARRLEDEDGACDDGVH